MAVGLRERGLFPEGERREGILQKVGKRSEKRPKTGIKEAKTGHNEA